MLITRFFLVQGYKKQYGDEPLLLEMHILLSQFSQIIQESPNFSTNLLLSHMGHQISWIKKDCFIWEFKRKFIWEFKRKQGISQADPVKQALRMLCTSHLKPLQNYGYLKTLQLEATKCEITKNCKPCFTVFWSFYRMTLSLQVSFLSFPWYIISWLKIRPLIQGKTRHVLWTSCILMAQKMCSHLN